MRISICLFFLIFCPICPLINGFIFSGATAPLGFWDPLGISNSVDIDHLAFLREAELKHSRWSMLSCISIPMIESNTHYPAIHEFDNLPLLLKVFIVALVGGGECVSLIKGWENPFTNSTELNSTNLNNFGNLYKLKIGYQPGNMGLGVIENMDYIEHDTINNLELNHGRFAMITSIVIFLLEGWYDIPLFATKSLELIGNI
tara:strand:- start:19 stop:624 length:606 start_codon:yes stop_codon:yes gene_type:complete